MREWLIAFITVSIVCIVSFSLKDESWSQWEFFTVTTLFAIFLKIKN